MQVEIWCCPWPSCPDHYAATGAGDLAAKVSFPKVEHTYQHKRDHGQEWRHTRAQCPSCRAVGRQVERVPVRVVVQVSVPDDVKAAWDAHVAAQQAAEAAQQEAAAS